MTSWVREAQLACMILTRLPCGRIEGNAPPISAAAWAFPLVGALVGALSGASFMLAAAIGLPQLAAALIAVAVAAVATGALHEDGLADTADGFGGGSTLSRKLEIMKDSRIGSYGVLALLLTLGLTASSMSVAGNLAYFVAIGATSRAMMLLPMVFLSPARDDGLGRSAKAETDLRFATGLLLPFAFAILVGALFVVFFMVLATLAMMILAKRQIGGQTGDVLGATQKVTECVGWLTAAALLS